MLSLFYSLRAFFLENFLLSAFKFRVITSNSCQPLRCMKSFTVSKTPKHTRREKHTNTWSLAIDHSLAIFIHKNSKITIHTYGVFFNYKWATLSKYKHIEWVKERKTVSHYSFTKKNKWAIAYFFIFLLNILITHLIGISLYAFILCLGVSFSVLFFSLFV